MDISERHVQAIWFDSKLRPKHLRTRRGSELRVLSPGEWNLGAGPDFRNAVLEVGRDRRRIVGDVEIHLHSADWETHGHGVDPNYRQVVAHVTWRGGVPPSSLPKGAVSVWLGRYFAGDVSFSPMNIDLDAYPYSNASAGKLPCERRFGYDPEKSFKVLASAGRRRLRAKALRLSRLRGASTDLEEVEVRQLFYEEVMSALGYAGNSESFRRVARRVPIAELPRDPEGARTALTVAGSFEEWNRRAMRPNNSPEHRLENAAWIFTSSPAMEYARAADFSAVACRKMIRGLSGQGWMGRGRAAAVIANVIVPWAIAAGRLEEAPDWLPPEDIPDVVRLTAWRLFGRDHNPAAYYATNGLCIQGILQIRREWCLEHYPDCANCVGIGDMI